MAELEPTENLDRPLFQQPWPGYWRTKAKLAGLTRFKNLIIHRETWAGSIDEACPIEELFPDAPLLGPVRIQRIEREIKRAQRLVWWDLNLAGVPTTVTHKEFDMVEQKDVVTRYDLILDYYRLPRFPNAHHAFEAVTDLLEQGIGVYEARLKHAKRDVINPVAWIAYLIRLPITVMERAGFAGHEKTQDLMLGAYARFTKIMMGVVMVLLTLLLGAKVPWKEIVMGLINFAFK